jgi:hypothetical protein
MLRPLFSICAGIMVTSPVLYLIAGKQQKAARTGAEQVPRSYFDSAKAALAQT